MRKLAVIVMVALSLAACDDKVKDKPKENKGPSAATVQVCAQVNTGAQVPSPLPMGLPFSLEQSVKEYQLGYGKDQSGLVGRIRTQCRKEGVAL